MKIIGYSVDLRDDKAPRAFVVFQPEGQDEQRVTLSGDELKSCLTADGLKVQAAMACVQKRIADAGGSAQRAREVSEADAEKHAARAAAAEAEAERKKIEAETAKKREEAAKLDAELEAKRAALAKAAAEAAAKEKHAK
jgi:hypothetical protein